MAATGGSTENQHQHQQPQVTYYDEEEITTPATLTTKTKKQRSSPIAAVLRRLEDRPKIPKTNPIIAGMADHQERYILKPVTTPTTTDEIAQFSRKPRRESNGSLAV